MMASTVILPGSRLRDRLSKKVRSLVDVILHIGAHRTGTTTIQDYLDRHEGDLDRAGLAVWTPRRTRSGLLAGLIRRPDEVTAMIEARAQRSRGLIGLELARTERFAPKLLISEENLIGTSCNNLRDLRLYADAGGRFARIAPAFRGQVKTVALSIRSPDAYWRSVLSFSVARGHRVPDRDMRHRLVTQPRRWRDLVRDVAANFPGARILVLPFERFAGQPETVVGTITGLDPVALPRADHTRRHLHRTPDLPQLRRLAPELPEGLGRWNPFTQTEVDVLRALYEEDIAWFRNGAEGLAEIIEQTGPKAGDPTGPTPIGWVDPPPEARGQDNGRRSFMG